MSISVETWTTDADRVVDRTDTALGVGAARRRTARLLDRRLTAFTGRIHDESGLAATFLTIQKSQTFRVGSARSRIAQFEADG